MATKNIQYESQFVLRYFLCMQHAIVNSSYFASHLLTLYFLYMYIILNVIFTFSMYRVKPARGYCDPFSQFLEARAQKCMKAFQLFEDKT